MNCRRVEELIPLYVEGDLDGGNAARVSVHIRTCRSCAELASEYRESQDWLHSNAAPELGPAFFSDLKRGVLAGIEVEKSRPSFFQLMAARWRWDAAFAAVALLLLIGGLLFYSHQRALSTGRDGDDNVAAAPKEKEQVVSPVSNELPDNEHRAEIEPHRQRKGLRDALVQAVEPVPSEFVVGPPNTWVDEAEAGGQTQESAEAETAPSTETNAAQQEPPAAESMTRIEIQTSDPSIRIIWFAPNNVGPKNADRRLDT